jgi:hypothetical protein
MHESYLHLYSTCKQGGPVRQIRPNDINKGSYTGRGPRKDFGKSSVIQIVQRKLDVWAKSKKNDIRLGNPRWFQVE